MAYQSEAILFGTRDGDSSALARTEGVCTMAHPGGKNELAQRAGAGYCACCTRPIRITAPNRCAAGELSKEKGRGLSLWAEHGPWATRRYAARVYAQSWGNSPRNWDWAAQSPEVAEPPLFKNLIGTVRANPPPYPIPPATAEDAPNPEAAMNSEKDAPSPGRTLSDRRRQPLRPTSHPSPSSSTPRWDPTPDSQDDGKGSPRPVLPPKVP